MLTDPRPLAALSADPSGTALGLSLPPGEFVSAASDGPWPQPLFWSAGREAGADDLARLLPGCTSAGLRPVLLDRGGLGERLWDGDLDPGLASEPGDDGPAVLADHWQTAVEDADDAEDLLEVIEPFDASWPGPAPAAVAERDPDAAAAEVAAALHAHDLLDDPRVALVPVERSADVPAALGWTGPVNHENDVALLSSVLRSWEERFGARVVALTFDRMHLSVAAPARTMDQALAVAAEHFAFCPDNITQGWHETLREYAAQAVLDATHWDFWWD